jgi:hypothetical protein
MESCTTAERVITYIKQRKVRSIYFLIRSDNLISIKHLEVLGLSSKLNSRERRKIMKKISVSGTPAMVNYMLLHYITIVDMQQSDEITYKKK